MYKRQVLVGHFASEAINFAEASAAVNAISISGTESTYQLPFFTAACDYTMIGEELMAAGAYILSLIHILFPKEQVQ